MKNKLISIDPANLEVIGETDATDPKEIPGKVANLKNKFREWRNTPLNDRIEIVKCAAQIIRRDSNEIAKLVTKESGKIYTEAKAEVDNSAYRLDYFANTATKALEEWIENLPGMKSVTRFEPLGVVASIKPWNFPVGIPLWSIVPALLAGNTVLFKPSERVPLIGERIFKIFAETGLPKGVMEIVQGEEDVGRAIVESDVDMIAFVGSQIVGKSIMKNSADKLRKLALELGGKDPMIICADCDLEKTVAGAITGVFKNCGQVCCGVERVFVAKEIFDKFATAAVDRVKDLKVGDGMDPKTDMGPMNRLEEMERVEKHLKDAVSKGAKILCGGKRIESQGYFFEATVITNITNEMLLSKEETFGPVMAIHLYNDIDEAIEMANDTQFGLTASVWSLDLKKADEIARKLQAGTIGINQVIGSVVEAPWGGIKKSGLGRMLGPEAVREFTETVNYRYPKT